MKKSKIQKISSLVKQGYEEIAQEFDNSRKKLFWPELKKISEDVKNGSYILDAGCGNGRLLENFKDKNINYLGFDFSSELIKLAQNNYPEREFKVLDICKLDEIEDQNFNEIYSIAVFAHLPGKELRIKALRELSKKLKDGGRIIISVWDLYSQKKFKKLLFWSGFKKLFNGLDKGDILFYWGNDSQKKLNKRYYHAFTEQELVKMVENSGLKLNNLYKADNNFWLIISK